MNLLLSNAAVRVLGSLVEKEATTPDYYPLSLNALMNACNQKSNREPVMDMSEDDVRQALSELQEQRLAGPARGADSRVTKYEHRSQEVFNFTRAENALFCVFLLRGAQTPGELRGRTERIFRFEELSDVSSGLQKLIDRELVKALPRQPGTKEIRYVHLLSGQPDLTAIAGHEETAEISEGQLAKLQEQITNLQCEVASLRKEIAELRSIIEEPSKL